MKKIHLYKEPTLMTKFDAFPYQKDAVDAVKDLEFAAIFHEQGLGKTKIAIDLLLFWLKNTDIDSVLIVTKKQLVQNWLREFKTHTSLIPAVLSTDRRNNYLVFCGPARVVITNYEIVVSEKEQLNLYLNTRNVAIIIDESAKLKNPKTKLTKTFFELSSLFKKRVIMTGTPIANRPYDIWAQIYFLDQGKSLGADFNKFKKETDLSNKLVLNEDYQKIFEYKVSAIYGKIKKFSVRETKNSGVMELPDKVYIQERVDFLPAQEELYNRICRDLVVQVKQEGENIIDDSSAIVKRLLRLVQVTSNPKLVDESYAEKSAKVAILDSLLSKIIEAGEKCIVWSNFIENIDYFTKKYRNYGSVKIHGKMNMSDRNRSVELFGTDESKVLFATPMSAKEGLTLTMANHVIFYDRGFSLDDYLQAQDRIHRISQKKTCYIHNIIINGSIDEWIDVLLNSKQNAAALAQGDLTLMQYKKTADYSFGDLIRIILFQDDNIR
ncbi:DEAD/DEAH box helicase [Murimonas intestini]|uniref:DEAD/DEAH box helicase n=1 Tax=Murimonas intestini TaxID=1337051 RepID=UPI0011DCEE9A|nr:DEAD/DEAH box helicase [Murimonas intestini]